MSIMTITVSGNAGCSADVYVARYEVYPNVDPTGVCVGLRTVCSPNGLSGYWDTVVPNGDIPSGFYTRRYRKASMEWHYKCHCIIRNYCSLGRDRDG